MSKKQVWFSLPAEYSPDGSGTGSETGPAFSWHEFSSLRESSKVTEGSDLSQYNSPPRSSLSGQELSQYSLRPSMEANPNSETVSTNESQDISTSQQESTMSDGQYGYDDANSTSSIHDSPHEEAVSSAIMEVSGELMLGKFSPHGNRSGGSESSELSDDDVRRPSSGGAIAKYPESSTGLSDNDWNPYATESDTNQTPRSPRSTASDEQNRVGFVSKATFSIAQPKDSTTTVSMTTGEVTVGDTKPERVVLSDSDGRVSDNLGLNGRSGAERLDILRYVMDNDEKQRTEREKDIARKEIRSPEDDLKRESPDTARSGYTEGSRSGRVSTESGQSLDTLRRESSESARSFHSGRQSAESGLSGRSSRSDLDRSGESIFSGRQSAESQHSAQSGRSRASQRSSARSVGSDRSERLDRLSDAAGDSLKELMQFESAQRAAPGFEKKQTTEMEETSTRVNRDGSGDSVVRTRLTARLEPYTSPVRSSKSPEPSSNVASSNGYISVAERERLLSDSPDVSQEIGRPKEERRETKYDRTPDAGLERNKPSHSNTNLPRFSESLPDRSPSDISMKRVASLFEETKRQVREAVAIPRPEPSGSEERFPLRERLTWSAHEDSFKSYEKDELAEKSERKMEKPRDPEVVRSLTSEEVARVLGKYSEDDTSRSAKTADKLDKTKADDAILVSAFDKVDDNHAEVNDDIQRRSIRTHDVLDGLRSEEVSDDEISKRVKALLSETDHLGILRENGTNGRGHEYIPRTIDYSRLQKDLQEIQDSLHDVPPPVANDSIHVQRKNLREGYSGQAEDSLKDEPRSLSTTCTTTGGRESGVSEYGRRLVWDHGADLEYDEGYGGQFIGTMTTTDTLSTKLRGSSDTDTLVVRPDSAATNDTDYDAAELEGTKTLTGSDITRAEKLVEQVMNRRAEGDLKESVEDIIARYRNERKDLFDRLQAPPVPKVVKDVNEVELEYTKPAAKAERPILKDPDVALPDPQQKGTQNQQMNGTKQPGLAERVYKILTSEEGEVDNFHNPEEKGMAKKVYKILANDRPQEQVNGILTETMANEHEMLQKLVAKPKDDSSLDDSGLNGTSESFDIEDKDIRKQLEYSLFSSPGKGEKSDFTALREVTSAPYSALSNAKSLLSTQMKKMSERNFDKSIELRTPYRQAIDCYPVYGVERLVQKETEPREAWMPARRSTERSGQQDVEPREAPIPARRSAERSGQEEAEHGEPREAWMPTRRSADTSRSGDRNKALASDRFYLTDKDRTKRDFDGTQQRTRTFSDPFEVSPGRMAAGSDRFRGEGHTRSRSEEAGNVSDLSQYSFVEPQYSPTERRMAQSPRSLRPATLGTPQHHRPQDNDKVVKKLDDRITNKQKEWSFECYTSVSDSSDPHRQSDSSDGNLWRYYGYQLHDGSRDPENDLHVPKRPLSPTENKRNRPVTNGMKQGELDFESPVKSLKYSRPSRSREKKPRNSKVNFQAEGHMSRSLPNYYPNQGFVEKVPISTDDVYELLTRSQAQEEKLAELQKRLLGQQEISQNSSSSSCQTPVRGQGEIRSHGNKAYPPVKTQEQNSYNGMFMKKGYMKRDSSPSPTESDTSGSRKGAKLRPYRPAGTRDVYYTESGEDNNESGTTLESSHPGSDDAAPPYIPSQFLGSRRDEPVKHPIGIYGNKEKDALSTIDENSVKDEKEKALSASGGSGKQGAGSDKHSTVTADTGYQTATMRSRSPASLKDDHEPNSNGHNAGGLDRPGFKTREEYQRDFERRERELKELLSKRNPVETQRDSLGTSTRSDPGEVLNDPGSRWEYRQSDQMNEFHRLEPEPAYPEDRLRYSRSKSDTDLVALTPDESQRYSSPMQPGVRFLEFSTQHSPIFAHHDSITYQTRGVPGGVPADLPRVPIEREQGQAQLAQELPRVYDRRPVVTAPELPRSDERRVTPTNTTDYPVRPLEPVEPPVQPLEPGSRSHVPRAADALGPVDLGADPRKMGNMRRTVTDTDRAKSPLNVRQKEMEVELEKLNKQLSDQVNEIQEKRTDENFEDNFPPSKKAQALREVLEQEYMDNLPPNINDMWTRFKERKEQSVSESSLNSTRLDALSGLLQNPTHHDVNSFVREKKELTEKHKMEEREKGEKFHEEKLKEKELERKAAAEKAAQLRNFRRQEMKNRHGLSEEESNGSYSEILIENERKREERRKKDETRRERRERKEGRAKSPSKKVSEPSVEERRKDRSRKTKDEGSVTDIRARNGSNRHSDTMDTLFSIPEDASFEQSPTKAESQMRSRQRRQRHVIDPLMKKLRDKIKMQRDKIDKERRKELQRVEKLKKLEMLLNAKTKGKLSDKAIDVELCDVSSTTSVSRTESSRMSDSTLAGLSTAVESDVSSHGSTTLKDSTIDSAIKLQVKRYPAEEYRKTHYVDSDTPESSDFSNIVVERVPERKSERKNKERKSSSKGKKTKVDEFGNKIRKEKKDKRRKDVFGVEFTEKDIAKQIKRYENYMTPERERLMRVENYLSPQRQGRMRDASTMYPSPVTVSPPSRRRRREVLMKSEAIQTSPALRSSSPSHAYDEVPVAPVPYMSRKSGKTSRRRTSPSPTRSAQTSFSASPPRKTSRSPSARKTSTSPASRRRFSPPITRRQAQSPIWKPESETTPPHNSMFTPEGDENTAPDTKQKREAESWFIPMKPSQPWRQPLKERQAFSVRQEAWEPKSVSQSTWKDIIHGDILKDKGDPNDISRDTKFDLDPEGQPVGEDETFTDSEEEADISRSKPLSKMSLQEAFQARRGNIISRLRERQKRLNLAAEQRKMEVFLQMERDRLFQEERKKEANPDAHPYSDNLHKPTRRVISKEEMKEMTKKRYKKLPEVIEQQKMKKRQDEYSLNRVKARLFNRKIQKKILVKAEKWGR
ncbi:uncharacterized protein LOC123546728 isoform X2 [Mercenaria mercenaria]|uniref:uncharacterized protein LOC123546728 isoform X2 n=1 Tax=Mercenaria mercenaria TaxID=6596 RepID=UPI00234F6FF9|nr:uncharacterized protein LOC123546728 isoform X2 [Mercenaria mercenaria]